MLTPPRPIAFILASSNHGTMIVNRNDYRLIGENRGYGVGFQILNNSVFDATEVNFAMALLTCRRKHFGDGVIAIDGGANIGVHTIEWARHMHNWGEVIGFEAQEVVFYALAGNVAINNCLNARVKLAALGEACGELAIPQPNYFQASSFGSLEIRQNAKNEFIGQEISYKDESMQKIPMVSIDSLNLNRIDFIKIDVEGMEIEVLNGAKTTLNKSKPIMLIEIIKSDRAELEKFVTDNGYSVFAMGINLLAIHESDPTLQQISVVNNQVMLTL
jgi:FkbM family methyltransferase